MKYLLFRVFTFFCQISLVFLTDTYVEENEPLDVLHISAFPHISNNFYVQLKIEETKDRLVMKKNVDDLALKFTQIMKRENMAFSFVCHYYYYFKGFTIRLEHPEHVLKIEKLNLDYISSIQADGWVYLTDIPQINTFPQIAMNIPKNIGNIYRNTKGVKAAIVDQGIRSEEPIFVIPGKVCNVINREGCRVKKTVDLVREYFLGLDLNMHYSVSATFENNGGVYGNHGTISASLVGGSDPVSPGVAQDVLFYDYRAFNHEGRAPFSLTHLAVNLAINDDVDLVLVAFGVSGLWYDRAYESAYKKNGKSEVIIISGNGNQGIEKLPFKVSHIAQPETVLSVGSVKNPFNQYCFFTLQSVNLYNQATVEQFRLHPFHPQQQCSDFSNLITSRSGIVINHSIKYFSNPQPLTKTDRILTFVVCEDSDDCVLQSLNVVISEKPPSAIIFVTKTALNPQEFTYLTYPAWYISNSVPTFKRMVVDGTIVSSKFTVNFAFSEKKWLEPNEFTSYGPSIFAHMKPQISAIGGNVYAYKYRIGDQVYYDVFSGTSLAASYVAGIACVYIKLCLMNHRIVTLEMLLTRLQNTAQPYLYTTTLPHLPAFSKGFAHPTLQQGAGLVNLNAMLRTEVMLIPSRLEVPFVNHQDPAAQMQICTCKLYNDGAKEMQYVITHSPALALSFNPEKKKYELINLSIEYQHFIQGAYNIYVDDGWRMAFKVKPYSNKKIEFHFFLNRNELQIPFTFFNGYFKFTPVSQVGESASSLAKEGYVPLSLPYLYIYGKALDFPVLQQEGSKEAFLTDFRIFSYLKDYLEPASSLSMNAPSRGTSFPIYRGFTLPMPIYTFQDLSKPIISLCFMFPLKQISFVLFDYFLDTNGLGTISIFENLGVSCYLFYAKIQPIRYNDDPVFPVDPRMVSNQGWNGDYYDYSGQTLIRKRINNGVYRICAHFKKKVLPPRSTATTASPPVPPTSASNAHYDWCSSPFVVALS